MGQGNTMVYTLVEVLYLVLFLFLRGIVGTGAMYWILTSSFFDTEEIIMSLALYIVSMIFIYDIAGYIRYKYKNEITEISREFFYATQLTAPYERELTNRIAEVVVSTQESAPVRCNIL